MWLSDSRCEETMEASWCSLPSLVFGSEILVMIDRCGKDLAWWNQNCFGNVRRELEKKFPQLTFSLMINKGESVKASFIKISVK